MSLARPSCLGRASAAAFLALGLSGGLHGMASQPSTAQSAGPAQSGAAQPSGQSKVTVQERRGRVGNLVGHGGPVKAIAVEPVGGDVLTGGFDYAMMRWPLGADGTVGSPLRYADHDGAVNAVAFAALRPNGGNGVQFALAAGDDNRLSLWTTGDGMRRHRFEGHSGKVVAVAVATDGRRAATASWDRTARIWDLAGLQPGPVLEGHTGPVNGVAFSNDGRRVFTASADGQIRVFDAATGALERAIYKHGWGINVLARIPGSDHLVFGALNGHVGIINGERGDVVRDLASHERPILALALHDKGGLVATGGGDGVIRVMRTADGAVIEEYRNSFGPVWALAFTPQGDGLYYGGLDDFVTLWRFAPREAFETIDSAYPRRFQVSGKSDDILAQGELQFARKCSICHTLEADGKNRAGPTLHRIFGRKIASLPGYPFSQPLTKLDIVWSAETIAKLFELGPDVFTPGSKMPLQKMTDKAQRDALIAFLKIATEPEAGRGAAAARSGEGQDQKR
jgi:cytochrome c